MPDTILADEGLFSGGGRILRSIGNAVFGAPTATDVDSNWDLFDDAPASIGTGVEVAKILGTSFGVPPAFTSGPGFAIGTEESRSLRCKSQAAGLSLLLIFWVLRLTLFQHSQVAPFSTLKSPRSIR